VIWEVLGQLWVLFPDFFAKFGRDFRESRRQDGAKMGQPGVKWGQESPKLDHVGAMMATWCSTCEVLCRFGGRFSELFGTWDGYQK